jgi:hypothetical protein
LAASCTGNYVEVDHLVGLLDAVVRRSSV